MYHIGNYHYQTLSQDLRKKLTIGGEPVVELDYSAMAIRLMYAFEQIQYPLDEDPYLIDPDIPELRDLFKHILLALVGCIHQIKQRKPEPMQ